MLPPSGVEYRNDKDQRLIALSGDGTEPYSVILAVWMEKDIAGKWVKDGSEAIEFKDGMRRQTEYRAGKMHGTAKQWHANGQLAVEEEYADDQSHGRYRRWNKEGQLECEVYHSFGVEVPKPK